jgi:asparagine synthase (glutamine-hydrolysing)
MNFFICLIRLTGEPIGDAERRPLLEHLASRGLSGLTDWVHTGSLSALVRRLDDAGPRVARAGTTIGVGDVRLDHPERVVGRLPGAMAATTHLQLALEATQADGSAASLLGDFAFVAWEPALRRLVAVRDVLGVKPLFYARLSQDLVAFSSHASLIAVKGTLSESYIAKYFVQTREEATIFDSVQVIPAAHTVSVLDRQWSQRQYWFPERVEIDSRLSPRDAIQEFRGLFSEAVRLRLGSGSVWSELSGGLDTSSIVSMSDWLHRTAGVNPRLSGTITYADSFGAGDESEFVDAVIQASGLRNEQVRDSWPWRDDEVGPIRTERPGPVTLFWSRTQRRNRILHDARAQVLLSGLGGDHILEGDLSFFADWLGGGSLRRACRDMVHWAAMQQRPLWDFAFKEALLPIIRTAGVPLFARERHLRIPSWIARGFRRRADMDAHLRGTSTQRLTEGPLPRYRSGSVARLTAVTRSLPRDQPWVGYERRYPFLYQPLVELTLRLPPEFMVHPYARKVVLREAMSGVLPEVVRRRLGKGGVNTRMLWALNHEQRLIESMLREPVLAEMGYVDPVKLHDAYVEARTGGQRLTVPLYSTLALETWIRIETGRWPPVEGRRPVVHVQPQKENEHHETIPEAEPERTAEAVSQA